MNSLVLGTIWQVLQQRQLCLADGSSALLSHSCCLNTLRALGSGQQLVQVLAGCKSLSATPTAPAAYTGNAQGHSGIQNSCCCLFRGMCIVDCACMQAVAACDYHSTSNGDQFMCDRACHGTDERFKQLCTYTSSVLLRWCKSRQQVHVCQFCVVKCTSQCYLTVVVLLLPAAVLLGASVLQTLCGELNCSTL